MSAKLRKVSSPTLLFLTHFQQTELFLSEWAYFPRSTNNVNFIKICFLNEAACPCVNMRKYITSQVCILWNIILKQLIYLYENRNSRKIQWPVKIVRVIKGFQVLLSLIKLCQNLPKWGPWSLKFVIEKILCNIFSIQKVLNVEQLIVRQTISLQIF